MATYKCPAGHGLILKTDRLNNLGTCPVCGSEWQRMTETKVEAVDPDVQAIEELGTLSLGNFMDKAWKAMGLREKR
jgi:hypothetical protein